MNLMEALRASLQGANRSLSPSARKRIAGKTRRAPPMVCDRAARGGERQPAGQSLLEAVRTIAVDAELGADDLELLDIGSALGETGTGAFGMNSDSTMRTTSCAGWTDWRSRPRLQTATICSLRFRSRRSTVTGTPSTVVSNGTAKF
jgi:hypothetical protein